jgi:hypothetical protein
MAITYCSDFGFDAVGLPGWKGVMVAETMTPRPRRSLQEKSR